MDPNNLTLEEAQLLLVENMLISRNMDKSLAQEFMRKLEEDLTTPARDFLIQKGIYKSEKAAYICVNALGVMQYEIEKIAANRSLTKNDCKYKVSPELREEIEHEWFVGLAEVEAEEGYFL